MGFLGSVLNTVFNSVINTSKKGMDDYQSGYDRGSARVSDMSNEELHYRLKNTKEHGVSSWEEAGKTRAMAEEYSRRKD